jgi:hypothetical protein
VSLSSFIARTGTNPNFVAFNAHCWFAFAVVGSWNISFHARLALAVAATLAALGKEFWFDLHYETTPPQTILDSLRDFAGYMAGTWGAVLAAWLGAGA